MSNKIYGIFRSIDSSFGRLFDSEINGFIGDDEFRKEGNDTMNAAEWRSYRSIENGGDPSFNSWVRLLAGKEARKMLIFLHLQQYIKKSERILDFGCGQSHIGVLFSSLGFQVHFCDNVENVFPAILPPFKEKFFHSDFRSFNDFASYDTIILTQIDYIFECGELQKFLNKAFEASTKVIFVNTQIVGPLRFLWNKIRLRARLDSPELKNHGFLRTLGKYERLGRGAGYSKVDIARSSFDELKTYFFITFHP